MSKQNKKPEQETKEDPLADLIQPKAKPAKSDHMAAMEQDLLQPAADKPLLDPETLAALSDLAEMEASLLLNPTAKPATAVSATPNLPDAPSLPDDDPLAELLDAAASELLDKNPDDIFAATDLAEAASHTEETIGDEEGETAVFPDKPITLETIAEIANTPEPSATTQKPTANDDDEPLAIFQQQLADDNEPLPIFQQQLDEEDDEPLAIFQQQLADDDETEALSALTETIAIAEQEEALSALQDSLATEPISPPKRDEAGASTPLSPDDSDALAALQPNEAEPLDYLSNIITTIDEEVETAYSDDGYDNDVMADLSSERLAAPLYVSFVQLAAKS